MQVIFARGKKRCGFDLEVSCSWSATVGDKEIQGSIRGEVNSDSIEDAELEVQVDGDRTAGDQGAAAAARGLQEEILGVMQGLLAELKDK